ncbi:hypothetical protein LCGC14_2202800, partial [marine sediment metagenome]
ALILVPDVLGVPIITMTYSPLYIRLATGSLVLFVFS